jgi:hypothetical protein
LNVTGEGAAAGPGNAASNAINAASSVAEWRSAFPAANAELRPKSRANRGGDSVGR